MQLREVMFYVGMAVGIVAGVAILESLGANRGIQVLGGLAGGVGLGYLSEWLTVQLVGGPRSRSEPPQDSPRKPGPS